MRVLIVIVQLLVALFLTASLMPIVFITVPAAQNDRVGLGIMLGLLVIAFAIITLLWPGRRRQER
jgi:hypothetical protein